MPHPKSTAVLATLLLCAAGCGQSGDAPESEKPKTPPPLQSEPPKTADLPTQDQFPDTAHGGMPSALETIFHTLNMRSFPSSFGPRLKYHCESYPFEYFPKKDVLIYSSTRMKLVNGDDSWIIEQLANNRIKIEMTITGMGSYHTISEYDLKKIEAADDLRADAAWIEQRTDCKPLTAGNKTKMGLHDLRSKPGTGGWMCGDFWGGGSVTPEHTKWKSLSELPQELDPSRHHWGPADMLNIGIKDHASMIEACPSGQQYRDVSEFVVYDRPEGTKAGKFVRISTYGHGVLNMVGFITLDDQGSYKVNFDAIAKEQLVLVITNKDGDWLDVSTTDGHAAWINLGDFEPNTFTLKYLPYLQRLESASELKLIGETPRSIHSEALDEAEVIYTLKSVRTALHPMVIRDDWIQVRFVAPPEYPAIGCGDEESDFDWVTGWIRWRDEDKWFVTEEHHYGC